MLSLGTSDATIKAQNPSRSFPFDSGFRCRRMLGRCLTSVVVAICLLAVAESENPSVDEIRNRCRDEYKLLEEQVSQMNKTRKVESDDQNVKCFVKCLMIGFEIMTEDGEITPENLSGMRYDRVIPCKDVTGVDSCDKAANLQNCMWRLLEKEEMDEAE